MIIRKVFIAFIVLAVLAFAGCTQTTQPDADSGAKQNDITTPDNKLDENKSIIPDVDGIKLGDPKETVQEIFGKDYSEKFFEEPGHFPEAYYEWEYEKGYTIIIGKDSNTVLQIIATAPGAKTNLGVKIGDKAETALKLYREKYKEPNSIHDDVKLYGIFKVEKDQALILDFDLENGILNPADLAPEETLKRIILTYPSYLDDSF